MNPAATEFKSPSSLMDIEGMRLAHSSPGFVEAIARAHSRRRRPLCLCRPDGVEMYIARLAGSYIVKRMPGTGSRHAPGCPSFEPREDLSGIGPLLGTAITEDPDTGLSTLKLGFSLSRRPGRTPPTRTPLGANRSATSMARLSLLALLHFLWDQAELTRWHPGFAQRRTWGAVRRQLQQAAAQMLTCGESLAARLYIPEPFYVDQQDAILARRHTRWTDTGCTGSLTARLLLMIAEVKEIMPSRHGYKAIIKHVPDLAFAVDAALYSRLERRFAQELALWSSADDIHMIIMATLSFSHGGLPQIAQLTLMTVTEQWLPVETMTERQLVCKLVRNRRRFTKMLRYDLSPDTRIPSLTLTDCGEPVRLVFADDG